MLDWIASAHGEEHSLDERPGECSICTIRRQVYDVVRTHRLPYDRAAISKHQRAASRSKDSREERIIPEWSKFFMPLISVELFQGTKDAPRRSLQSEARPQPV